ncbi:BsuPI-related putative proteinase inhibitor [Halobaculum magnesiiphilum]|uniref:Intracellular proteinase inhibitor BsuPI domain-containing protein n=1 Tax=Halobaculum magnesiiphilum TaxID=1017351 RepID=A0A8T8WFD8_9EURY|nr:BsuPI-related putative proteinase inhibitor [Halobaculum magnesiiphilum]QZP38577.1 hypothetical protein K6T50_05400 [Halobaculum magnesiiphilum]
MSEPLDATLTIAATDGGAAFSLVLTVENVGADAVDLSFSDGQRVEFVASEADAGDDGDGVDGAEIWRWSDGRAFAMALGSETLAPGESVDYEGEWRSPEPGEYEVTGSLAANDAEATASMTVVVPDEK